MCLGYFVPPAHPSRPRTNVTASGTLPCSCERGPRGTKGSFRVWKTMRGPFGDRQQWGHSSEAAAEASVTNPQVPPSAFPSEGVSPDRTRVPGHQARRAGSETGLASPRPGLSPELGCGGAVPVWGPPARPKEGKGVGGGEPRMCVWGGREQDQR